MSQLLINQYLAELDRIKRASGSTRESVIREAFKDLLKGWGRQHDLVFVAEYEIQTAAKERRYVDGALVHELRVPFGYWEAKDSDDDLDAEIVKKLKRSYPQDNIIFEDSTEAVLIQHRAQVMRCDVTDVRQLEKLLHHFFSYERPEIADFRKAVAQFKDDLPAVLEALRAMIANQYAGNAAFKRAAKQFLKHAQEVINPRLNEADVREMLIQHILTEEIFSKVFDDSDFHRQNNVAKELYKLEETFFTGGLKKTTLKGLEAYYSAIRATAAQISNHHEKQTFLKVIYENFYKVYNPKAADRLGVVYTPNEIVRFMISGADWLCEHHFSRSLVDKNVEILDPATGTGTFICELLEHFRGQPNKLAHKYREELHANEVAILPYYVANLNIEATYAAITSEYQEFANLCFVDTLDNVGLHTQAPGTTGDLFGRVSEENVARIKRQNARKISVIIGNPPYNANQANENDNNKNREYPPIDGRIRDTYIAKSTARKTKQYDMYTRFFRWASDRLDSNGVLTFVTNRSFLDKESFDGFRKTVVEEFSEIRIFDLGGDVRANPKLSGTRHNVFGIQTGVAISFFIKRVGAKKRCRIFYARRPESETAEAKLAFLTRSGIGSLDFEEIRPDSKGHWLGQTDNDFDKLLPMASKQTKAAKLTKNEKAIFKLYSLGISTNRDEWIYADDKAALVEKMRFFVTRYDSQQFDREPTPTIKWSRNLKRRLDQGRHEEFTEKRIARAAYRPFNTRFFYDSELFIDEGGAKAQMFPVGRKNRAICFSDVGSRTHYVVMATEVVGDLHFGSSIDAYQQVPLYRFDERGIQTDNITDWALKQFVDHYKAGLGKRQPRLDKEGIFHYVYAVLHDPIYREQYSLNLKSEFPRVPYYGTTRAHFWQWAEWGRQLMELHIGYEQVEPYLLKRTDVPDRKARAAGLPPKCLLKLNPEDGCIVVDSETTLSDIPPEVWTYRLGSRSALEWVLDQCKEKRPKDPTILAKFDTYRFADHKERVVDLLARVTTVSTETMRIIGLMKDGPRG